MIFESASWRIEMSDLIQGALAPLAAFWVALDGFMKAATFANGIRDTIIIGAKDGEKLTLEHRTAMCLDWSVSTAALVVASFLFSAIVYHLGVGLVRSSSRKDTAYGAYAIAAFTLLGGVLFMVSGISDFLTIRGSLRSGGP
jgi:hypothetical protein